MYLMIDNFDSFVYNLKAYFEEMGRCVTVKRCDRISLQDVEDLEPEGIILSPGPGRPWEAKMCVDVVNMYKGKIPILGVCLDIRYLGIVRAPLLKKEICQCMER